MTDDGGRYTYEKQPEVCKWNCMKLAECLEPLVPMEKLTPILETYDEVYEEAYHGLMRRKVQSYLMYSYRHCHCGLVGNTLA